MYYVYRFKNKEDNIIYIGKTQQNIGNRMGIHFGETGHLNSDCYKQTKIIEYIQIQSKIDMDIKEIYYIGKWKPMYNNNYNMENEQMTIIINEDIEWIIFNDDIGQYINRSVKKAVKSLTIENIRAMVDCMDVNSAIGARDKALLLIGFKGNYRRSELVSINMEDIFFNGEGVDIKIYNHKTNNYNNKSILYTGDNYCPVNALQEWLKTSCIKSSSLFRSIKKGENIHERLSDESVSNIVKKYTQISGLDPKLYAGDSLCSLPHSINNESNRT